jgi:hypothetical protein
MLGRMSIFQISVHWKPARGADTASHFIRRKRKKNHSAGCQPPGRMSNIGPLLDQSEGLHRA